MANFDHFSTRRDGGRVRVQVGRGRLDVGRARVQGGRDRRASGHARVHRGPVRRNGGRDRVHRPGVRLELSDARRKGGDLARKLLAASLRARFLSALEPVILMPLKFL